MTDLFRRSGPKVLWHGAEAGAWVEDSKALREFARRFGAGECCNQNPVQWYFCGYPRHLAIIVIPDPCCSVGRPQVSNDGAPVVRVSHMDRDCFGRYCRTRTYFLREDFDRFLEWQERHVAERSVEMLVQDIYAR